MAEINANGAQKTQEKEQKSEKSCTFAEIIALKA
jgi:hypothetical protein